MDDTSAEVRELLRKRYAELTGTERLTMGVEMFETARTMALASFPAGLSQHEVRRRLCERFYGTLAARVFGSSGHPTGSKALVFSNDPRVTDDK